MIRISVDDEAVLSTLGRAPREVRTAVSRLVEAAAIDIQREMRLVAPVAVTGDLRRSIRYSFSPTQLRAEVTPNVPYADDVERGSKPRQVSVAEGTPLRLWAQQKGINPWALRNSIAKTGTQPHPFIQPTFDKMKPKVETDIAVGISQVVEGLNS